MHALELADLSPASLSLVVRCNTGQEQVRYQVLVTETALQMEMNVPFHGEVCPESWIYHRLPIGLSLPGVRFNVTVHTGDVYFMMSRWAGFPGFSTCNNNEMQLRGRKARSVELCNKAYAEATREETQLGYVGLFGGYSCAVYTIEASGIDNVDICSVATKGRCPRPMDRLLPDSGVWA